MDDPMIPPYEPIAIPLPTPFPVGPINVYLLKSDPVTLIDAGALLPEAWQVFESALKEHGLAVGDIQRVFLTHHHLDHVGLLPGILEINRAEVWAHPDNALHYALTYSFDDGYRRFFRDLMFEMGVPQDHTETIIDRRKNIQPLIAPYPVDITFTDGGTAGPFTTYFVPGHSATDTLLLDHKAGITFTGDHILERVNPNPILRRPIEGQERPKSLLEYRDSLRRTHGLCLGRCYPGHGEPFDDHRRVVEGIVSQHRRRRRRLTELASPEGMTPYAFSKALYPRQKIGDTFMCLSVTVGHLEALADTDRMILERRDGIIHYRLPETG